MTASGQNRLSRLPCSLSGAAHPSSAPWWLMLAVNVAVWVAVFLHKIALREAVAGLKSGVVLIREEVE